MHDQSTVSIPLISRTGVIRGYTLIDAADAEWANQWRWNLIANFYAGRCTNSKGVQSTILLHRALMSVSSGDGLSVDHINRVKLDNRRSNLRAIPRWKNPQNVASYGKTSPYRGVCWDKSKRKWTAYVWANGKMVNLGRFSDEQEAADVAKDARMRLLPYAID